MAANTNSLTTASRVRRKPKPKGSGKTVTVNVALPASIHKKVRMKAIADELTLEQAITAACECWTK